MSHSEKESAEGSKEVYINKANRFSKAFLQIIPLMLKAFHVAKEKIKVAKKIKNRNMREHK